MSEWRTRFYMKCRKCGYKTPIYTQQELCCAKCGEGYDVTCYNCGQVFRPEDPEMRSVSLVDLPGMQCVFSLVCERQESDTRSGDKFEMDQWV